MNKTISRMLPALYACWAILAIAITFLTHKLSSDTITHIIIAVILTLSLAIFKYLKPKNPQKFFICLCVILASLGEGAYMISKPVLPSLLVGRNSTFASFAGNYAADLLLTIPAYFLIFWVIWRLINTYHYTRWEYIFLMALGQAIGDGFATFLAQPVLLLFIPYVMLNYHAMNIAPYLCIESHLDNKPRSNSRWKYPAAVLALFIAYFLGGALIKIAAKLLNLA